MRIIQLTPGTGSFYCGTCLRDHALVLELRRQGHDVLMAPLYLPLAVEEAQADEAPLFYGGINVYLQQKASLFRTTPRWLDRLFDSPGLLRAAAKRAGMTSARELGEMTLSMLRGEEGQQVKELERLTDWLATEARPDVVLLSTGLLLGLARRIKERTGVPIGCFLNGEDTYLDSLPEGTSEAAWDLLSGRARDVDMLFPVSRYYADLMGRRASLPPDRVRVIYPGISLDGFPAPTSPPEPPVLGYLARMCPAKGLETLVEAYILLRARDRVRNLKLRVGGSCTEADGQFVRKLQERLAAKGLAEDVEFLPNLSREAKLAFLGSLSVLSVPATYGEAFGLYVIEAMAAGVPVVQPRHAAFPELIEETGGGVLCEPDDPQSLAEAVEGLFEAPEMIRDLGERGRQSVLEKFTSQQMAENVIRALGDVVAPAQGETVALSA
jgi:glycosyltransferase involved in cell wall biosynthesis